ncbi:MAG: hypothetical protein ACRCT1_02535 [Microcoleaceae cyanobacterium]
MPVCALKKFSKRWKSNLGNGEEGRRKKEEGRRQKEEGRRKREEGRRKKEEGRGLTIDN